MPKAAAKEKPAKAPAKKAKAPAKEKPAKKEKVNVMPAQGMHVADVDITIHASNMLKPPCIDQHCASWCCGSHIRSRSL